MTTSTTSLVDLYPGVAVADDRSVAACAKWRSGRIRIDAVTLPGVLFATPTRGAITDTPMSPIDFVRSLLNWLSEIRESIEAADVKLLMPIAKPDVLQDESTQQLGRHLGDTCVVFQNAFNASEYVKFMETLYTQISRVSAGKTPLVLLVDSSYIKVQYILNMVKGANADALLESSKHMLSGANMASQITAIQGLKDVLSSDFARFAKDFYASVPAVGATFPTSAVVHNLPSTSSVSATTTAATTTTITMDTATTTSLAEAGTTTTLDGDTVMQGEVVAVPFKISFSELHLSKAGTTTAATSRDATPAAEVCPEPYTLMVYLLDKTIVAFFETPEAVDHRDDFMKFVFGVRQVIENVIQWRTYIRGASVQTSPCDTLSVPAGSIKMLLDAARELHVDIPSLLIPQRARTVSLPDSYPACLRDLVMAPSVSFDDLRALFSGLKLIPFIADVCNAMAEKKSPADYDIDTGIMVHSKTLGLRGWCRTLATPPGAVNGAAGGNPEATRDVLLAALDDLHSKIFQQIMRGDPHRMPPIAQLLLLDLQELSKRRTGGARGVGGASKRTSAAAAAAGGSGAGGAGNTVSGKSLSNRIIGDKPGMLPVLEQQTRFMESFINSSSQLNEHCKYISSMIPASEPALHGDEITTPHVYWAIAKVFPQVIATHAADLDKSVRDERFRSITKKGHVWSHDDLNTCSVLLEIAKNVRISHDPKVQPVFAVVHHFIAAALLRLLLGHVFISKVAWGKIVALLRETPTETAPLMALMADAISFAPAFIRYPQLLMFAASLLPCPKVVFGVTRLKDEAASTAFAARLHAVESLAERQFGAPACSIVPPLKSVSDRARTPASKGPRAQAAPRKRKDAAAVKTQDFEASRTTVRPGAVTGGVMKRKLPEIAADGTDMMSESDPDSEASDEDSGNEEDVAEEAGGDDDEDGEEEEETQNTSTAARFDKITGTVSVVRGVVTEDPVEGATKKRAAPADDDDDYASDEPILRQVSKTAHKKAAAAGGGGGGGGGSGGGGGGGGGGNNSNSNSKKRVRIAEMDADD